MCNININQFCDIISTLFFLICSMIHLADTKILRSSHNSNELNITGLGSLIDKYFINNIKFIAVHIGDQQLYPEFYDFLLHYINMNKSVPLLHLPSSWSDESYYVFSKTETIENSVAYVIFTSYTSESCLPVYNWTGVPFWNPQARFLLIITNFVNVNSQITLGIFQDCWNSFNIMNIALFFTGHLAESNYIVNYNPFTSKVDVLEVSNILTEPSFDVYSPKKICDTNGFTFNIKASPTRELADIVYSENNTIEYIGPSSLAVYAAVGKLNGTFKNLPAHHTIQATEHKFSRTLYADEVPYIWALSKRNAYPHDRICYTFIVPKSEMLPKYLNIVMPLTLTTWLSYFITFIAIGLFWKFVCKYDNVDMVTENVWLETIRLALNGISNTTPRNVVRKIIVLCATILNLVVTSSYTGCLTTFLFTTHFYPDLDKLMHVFMTDLKISVFVSVDDLFEILTTSGAEFENLDEILSKFVSITDDNEALDMVANHKNLSRLLTRITGVHKAANPRYYKDGIPMLHVTEECYLFLPASNWVMTPNNPFLGQFNYIIMSLLEAGFIFKWRRDYTEYSAKMSKILNRTYKLVPVSMSHTALAFIIIVSGFIISVITLLCEMLVAHISYLKNRVSYCDLVTTFQL